MFIDGVAYASIARNMADHYGSFWQPYYTETMYPFYEHPPLGFWLQSWGYWLCGDGIYVEAIWGGVIVGILLLISLAALWRRLAPQDMVGPWFPLLLVAITPMTSWALANNMLEPTMTLFVVLAVWLCVCSVQSPDPWRAVIYGVVSGLSLCAALLVKGPVALFPLVTPWLVPTSEVAHVRKRLLILLLLVATMTTAFLLMGIAHPAAFSFLTRYLRQQVVSSVTGARGMSSSRFMTLAVVSREALVPFLLGGVLTVVLARRASRTRGSFHTPLLSMFLGLALAGSLPILISVKQQRWYAFPSLPFYALAIAVLYNAPALYCERLLQQYGTWRRRACMAAMAILLIAVLWMIVEWQALRRDADFHADFSVQPFRIEARHIISVYPGTLATHWSLVANMQRTLKASLSAELGHPYLLTTIEQAESIPSVARYQQVHPAHPRKYLLLKLVE